MEQPESTIMKYFEYNHLPDKLQDVSRKFAYLAYDIDKNCTNNAEKSAKPRNLCDR